MADIIHDPIRDALRGLKKAGRITGWTVHPPVARPGEEETSNGTQWIVSNHPGWTKPFTTDEVNDLIRMFWADAD